MQEKLPPFDIDAEQSTIGSLLIDSEAIKDIVDFLAPADFYQEANKWIYEACLALHYCGEEFNEVTVAHEMVRQDTLEKVGGAAFLSHLIANTPTSFHVKYYAGIVRNLSIKRQLIAAAGKIAAMAYSDKSEANDVLAQSFGILESLSMKHGGKVKRLNVLAIKKATSKPPVYEVTLNHGRLYGVDWEEIVSFKKFSNLVAQNFDFVPLPIKQVDWLNRVNALLEKVEMVIVPADASTETQLEMTIAKHMRENAGVKDVSDLAHAMAYIKDGYYWISSRPLLNMLRDRYRITISPGKLHALFREWCGSSRVVRIGNKTARLWGLPAKIISLEEEEETEVKQEEMPVEVTKQEEWDI